MYESEFFNWMTYLFINDDIKEACKAAEKKLGVKNLYNANCDKTTIAFALGIETRSASIIVMQTPTSMEECVSTLAHEIIHVSWEINNNLGLEFEKTDNKEMQCYLVDGVLGDFLVQLNGAGFLARYTNGVDDD